MELPRPQANTACQFQLTPMVETKEELADWLVEQKGWWRELQGRRRRISRRPLVEQKRFAEKLGLDADAISKIGLKTVTWKIGGSKVAVHDYFKIPSEEEVELANREAEMDSRSSEEEGNSSSQEVEDAIEDSSEDLEAQYVRKSRSTRTRRRTRSRSPLKEIPKEATKKSKSRKKWINNDWCHLCKVGGDLVCCNWCPRSYHPTCIGREDIPKGYFSCPQHICSECGRKASDAGGLLFRCVVCPCAYCEDHVPSEHNSGRKDLADGCEELEDCGYKQPSSAYYIVCSHSCNKYYDAFKNDFKGYREENRLDGKEHVIIDGVETLVDKHQCACTGGIVEPEQLHCICQTPYDEEKFYIGCDDCRKWYHGSCVGVEDGDIPEDDAWRCPACVEKFARQGRGDDEDWFQASKRALRHNDSDEDYSLSETPESSDIENGREEDFGDVIDMSVGSKFIEEMTLAEREIHFRNQQKEGRAPTATSAQQMSDLANVVKDWGVDKVCSILTAMNMGIYIPMFKRHNITGMQFLMLDPNRMVQLGMKPFHAMRLYNTVATTIAGTSAPKVAMPTTFTPNNTSGSRSNVPVLVATPAPLQNSPTPVARATLIPEAGMDSAHLWTQNKRIHVDPQQARWPQVSSIASVAARLAVPQEMMMLKEESNKPLMVIVQVDQPTPLYMPETGSMLFDATPPGCPLPKLLEI
mmetsp:Transcript_6234/g.11764  ORF Transcript_6234/g.11764 Transcript_6234/m.11764 type:complete len:696 (+) Transcript_6234:1-2088(+)